ncbi:MAG: hypothetical protein EHM64_08560 [Ignavibacteriae bacterium]|nr:MAG: hypothetical protein EHM64_08560 [Ignavibacteriota bacterium]
MDSNSDLCAASLDVTSAHQQNSSSSPGDNHVTPCSCICHVPSVEYKSISLSYPLPVALIAFISPSTLASVTGKEIFRPPLAS